MTPMTMQRKGLLELIENLHDSDIEKVVSYAAFLRHLEEQEDNEDQAYVKDHKNEPAVPLEDALKELGL